ncbi:MAG TPA: TIGR04282 family arsenosugar biosynthesis glycosyltransferase, partial [Planctomycetaceae bacterium]|nr:TIGR04282 family arsenosugar biosynthesis glycosyltransferase [Planctomycetaceae bacterium]
MTTLGLFVKYPAAGRVKTRLAAELGADQAAALYATFVAALTDRFRRTADARVLCYSPATDEAREYFAAIAGSEFALWPQPEADLGARMAQFFAEHLRQPEDRAVIIGSDSPTLPLAYVGQAFELLRDADCVIGPATDGGYYLIGQRGFSRPIFDGVAWSTSRVLDQTVALVRKARARLALLPPWYDVDTPDDWRMLIGHLRALQWAGEMPPERALARLLAMD